VLIKVLAIPVFFGAGLANHDLRRIVCGGAGAPRWPGRFAVECVLLTAFLCSDLSPPFRHDPNAPPTIGGRAARPLGDGGAECGRAAADAGCCLDQCHDHQHDIVSRSMPANCCSAGTASATTPRRRAVLGGARAAAVLVRSGIGFIVGSVAGAYGYVWFGLWCLTADLAALID